ncbi:MAG: NAD-dependent epimerase/dehydratase family protein [Flammeovirgaceae bacterium]|nr:NAD-dependent epimerase/dehydratase family protein [Flammeovirgaceae bacterium]
MKTALVAGATGMIGQQLVNLLVNDGYYDVVKVMSRRPFDLQHTKIQNIITDLSDVSGLKEQIKADHIFCCLGTTMRKAKTKENFYKVDFTFPVEIAKHTKSLGASAFMLVSATGANKNSMFYYNRVKGDVEEALSLIGFSSLHIFRPSLLLGTREESRIGEDVGKVVYKILGFMFPANVKAIDSLKVAKAMVHFAKQETTGVFFHDSKLMQSFV